MEKQYIPRGCIQMSTGSDQQPLQLILGNRDNNLEINFTPGKCRKTKAFHMNRELWIPPPAKTTRRIRPCCLYKYPTNEITLHLQDDRSCSTYGLPMVIESKHLENFKAILYPYCENREVRIDRKVSQKGIEDCKKHIETNYIAQCNVLKESEKLLNEQENKRKALKRYISVLKKNMDDINRSISEVRNIRNSDHELGLEKNVSTQWNAPEICKEDMHEMRFMKPSRTMDTGKEHDSDRDIVDKCSDHKHFEITATPRTSSFEIKRDQREYKEHRFPAAANGKSESSSESDQRSNKEVENLMMKLANSIRISKQLIDAIYEQEGDVNVLQRKYIKGAEALYNSQQKLLEELNQVKDIGSSASSRNGKKEGRFSCSDHENLLKKTSGVHDSTFQLDDFEIDANNTINKIKHKKVKLTSSPCFEIHKQKHILEEQLAQARSELKDLQNKLETSKCLGIKSLTIDNKEKLKDGESKEMTKEVADSKMFKSSKNHIKPSSEEIPVYFLKEFNSHEILHRKAEKPKPSTPQAQLPPHLLEDLDPIHETSSYEDQHQFSTKKSSSDNLIRPISENEVSEFKKLSSETRKSSLPAQDSEEKRKTDKINEKYPLIVKVDKYDKMPHSGTSKDEDSFKESYLFNQKSYSKTASNERNHINNFINRRPADAMLSEDSSNSRKFYPLIPVQESFDSDKFDEVSPSVTHKDQDSFKEPNLFNQRSHSKTASNEKKHTNGFIDRRSTDAMLLEDSSNSRQFHPVTPVDRSSDSFGTPDTLIYGSLDETSEELDPNEIHTATNAKLRQMQDMSKLANKNSSGFEMRGRSKSEPYGTTFEKSPEKERSRGYSCFAPIGKQERLSGFQDSEVARRKGIRAFYREHYPTENKKTLDQEVYEETDPKYSHQISERQAESEQLQQFSGKRSADNGLSLDHSDKESSEELHSYDLPSSFMNMHSSEDSDFDGKRRKSKLQSTPLPNRFLLHPDIRNSALPRESQTFSSPSTSTNWASPNLKYVITTTPDKSDLPLRRKLFESNRPYRSSPEISDMQKASYKINTLYHQIMS
ncbi:uncharacterized protein LOC118196634 [Stegodyphus dumicola]|uniref:uncharacterized protein LOC118196634 n=1 Tax=Stegodyphus dumicola TaxID=202533 RepID=UPI0015ABEA23|nr:uncharacterized protein LOC118196634 [Stegodyphus dumicola]